ncbi:zinc finger BED domain-containing protein RICESLEEPER 2-like isoform X2 [Daucus carota subsp. sativus]|uniref:zinc finger BED domain-containing protein RICESLEEPER 2-like isoform X2 n=1 Tax=Daucus carota subsp. sativus TaxID=79200 RepID=UPI003082EA9D
MLKAMYGDHVGGSFGKSLEETLRKMFDEYKSRIAPKNQRGDAREPMREEDLGQVHPSQLLRMQFEKDIGLDPSEGSASDLEEYLGEKPKTFRDFDGFDILEWWRHNSIRFPILSQMAQDVLAFPISTVASESAFSTGGRVLNDFRSSLRPKMVEALICAQDWMRRTIKALCVEEDPEEMKQLDEALDKMNMDASSTAASATGTSQPISQGMSTNNYMSPTSSHQPATQH